MSNGICAQQRLPVCRVLFPVLHKQNIEPNQLFSTDPRFQCRQCVAFGIPLIHLRNVSGVRFKQTLQNRHVEPPRSAGVGTVRIYRGKVRHQREDHCEPD